MVSPPADEPSLKRQRQEYFDRFLPFPFSPSALGQPSAFAELQKRPEIQFFCNRPRSVFSTPITLLHRAFGSFVDDSENHRALVLNADSETSAFVLAFADMMCQFLPSGGRAEMVRELIMEHFQIKLEAAAEVPETRHMAGGQASVGSHVYLNVEGENEACGAVADPAIKSLICGHYHVHKEAGKFLDCVFPCLHLYFFGMKCHFVCGLIGAQLIL
jgi:hypothetical protein